MVLLVLLLLGAGSGAGSPQPSAWPVTADRSGVLELERWNGRTTSGFRLLEQDSTLAPPQIDTTFGEFLIRPSTIHPLMQVGSWEMDRHDVRATLAGAAMGGFGCPGPHCLPANKIELRLEFKVGERFAVFFGPWIEVLGLVQGRDSGNRHETVVYGFGIGFRF